MTLLEQVRLDDRKFQFWTGFSNYGTFKAFLKRCLTTSMEGVGAIGRMRDTGEVVKRFQRILTSRKQIKQPS